MTEIERVDLGRVDTDRLRNPQVLDHLLGGPRLDSHRPKRDLAAELLGRDLEDPAPFGRREDEALSAAHRRRRTRRYRPRPFLRRCLRKAASSSRPATSNGVMLTANTGGTRPGGDGSHDARKVTGLWTTDSAGYQLISADSHVNEPPDLWLDRVPAALRPGVPASSASTRATRGSSKACAIPSTSA